MASPISVVVPTRDRAEHLERCLRSLLGALGPDDELLAVDSASRDAAAVAAATAALGVTLVRCDEPGAARARNAGWRRARHSLVAFVDDDVFVAAGWAEGLREAFAAHPDAAFVTGRVDIPPDQRSERPIALKDELEAHLLDGDRHGNPGHSANLAVRRDVLESVGGFDENFGPGAPFLAAEDLDLFDRVYQLGRVGWYAPGANAWHDQWRGRPQILRTDFGYGVGGGARIVKLWRRDRDRARPAARMLFWTWGLHESARAARHRRAFMASTAAMRVVGGCAGMARALAGSRR